VQFKKKTDLYYHSYHFEHGYLDKEINKRKTKIGFLTFKLNKYNEQLKSLKTKVSSVVFGSKRLFKSQYTIDTFKKNHKQWSKKWEEKRYRTMTISGRKDAASGNFVFKYDVGTRTLTYKAPSGVLVEVKNLLFPYGQEKVESAILTQKIAKTKRNMGNQLHGLLKITVNIT
jgi:hypothetical protein